MLLIAAYAGRMAYEVWRPVPQLRLLWANTMVLILTSVALQWARVSVRRGQMDGMRVGLLAGGALTVVFLLGQILAWRQLATMDYFEVNQPCDRVLLSDHGIARAASVGRFGGLGQDRRQSMGRFRRGEGEAECGTVHRLLALPASGLVGAFWPAVCRKQFEPLVDNLWDQINKPNAHDSNNSGKYDRSAPAG